MLYIKVENNVTINHPVTIENLVLIYPNFDVNNPPDGYLPFTRASAPANTDPFTVNEATYVVSADSVTEVYVARTMTEQEKQVLFASMEQQKPYPSWMLNTTLCQWEPPVTYPTDGNKYMWDEDTTSWIILEEL
jgi:hypothetical protein